MIVVLVDPIIINLLQIKMIVRTKKPRVKTSGSQYKITNVKLIAGYAVSGLANIG